MRPCTWLPRMAEPGWESLGIAWGQGEAPRGQAKAPRVAWESWSQLFLVWLGGGGRCGGCCPQIWVACRLCLSDEGQDERRAWVGLGVMAEWRPQARVSRERGASVMVSPLLGAKGPESGWLVSLGQWQEGTLRPSVPGPPATGLAGNHSDCRCLHRPGLEAVVLGAFAGRHSGVYGTCVCVCVVAMGVSKVEVISTAVGLYRWWGVVLVGVTVRRPGLKSQPGGHMGNGSQQPCPRG